MDRIPPVLNRGVISNWLEAKPSVSSMLTVDTLGDIGFQDIPVAEWGSIGGDLANQTDLSAYLTSLSEGLTALDTVKLNSADFTFANIGGTASDNATIVTALSAYLPKTGGTLTGALSGTSASFSSSVNWVKTSPWGNFTVWGTDAGTEYLKTAYGLIIKAYWMDVALLKEDAFVMAKPTASIGWGNWSLTAGWYRDANNIIAQRNGTNAQAYRLYGTYTDSSNYRRLYISSTTAGAFTIGVQGLGTGASGNTLSFGSTIVGETSFGNTGYPLGLIVIKQQDNSAVFSGGTASQGIEFRAYGSGTARGGIGLDNSDTLQLRSSNSAHIKLDYSVELRPHPSYQVKVYTDNGLNIRNNADTAYGPVLASTGIFSSTANIKNTLTLGTSGANNNRAQLVLAGDGSSFGWIQLREAGWGMYGLDALDGVRLYSASVSTTEAYRIRLGHMSTDRNTFTTRLLFDYTDWVISPNTTFSQRNGVNAQRFELYGTYTDASNYRRLYLSSTTAGAFTLGVEGLGTGASGNTFTINNALTLKGTLTHQPAAGGNTFIWDNNGIDMGGGRISNLSWVQPSTLYLPGILYFGAVGSGLASAGGINVSSNNLRLYPIDTGSVKCVYNGGSDAPLTASTITATAPTSTSAAAVFKAAPSQSTNIVELKNNAGSNLSYFGGNGDFYGTSFAGSVYSMSTHYSGGFALGPTAGIYFGNTTWPTSGIKASFVFDSGNHGATASVALRYGGAAQTFRIYGTYTDASNYRRLYLSSTTAGAFTLGVEGLGTGASGNTLTIPMATVNNLTTTPAASAIPVNNGELTFEATSNTTLTVKYKGSDGVVRSATLTLS